MPTAAAVILAGGQGTRLWPLSRARKPKQFQDFAGSSLLRLAVDRVAEHVPRSHIYVSTTADLRSAVLDSGCDLDDDHLILEASPAGPATAFALSTARVNQDLGDVPTLICPSDHFFSNRDAVHDALDRMLRIGAKEEAPPAVMGAGAVEPDPRLGYLRAQGTPTPEGALEVVQIREKPPVAVAQEMIDEGSWFWNTACYVVRPSVALAAYRSSHPAQMDQIVRDAVGGRPYDGPALPGHEMDPFFDVESFPFLVPLAEGWSDVGNWEAFLAAVDSMPEHAGHWIELDTTRTAVFNETGRTVVTIGTHELVIIVHDDAVFVMDRNSAIDPDVIVRSRSRIVDHGMESLL